MIPYIAPTVSICHVDRVIDGDTISCDKIKIRLCAIDSPEKSQAYGAAATTFLTKLILNQNIRIVSNSLDIYGRVLGEVWIGGGTHTAGNRFVNAEMLQAGMAYRYGECPTQKHILESAEKSAIANKLGVWQRDNIRPWDYRYRERHNLY